MEDYLTRFQNLADEIASHPWLQLREFQVNQPASDDIFEAVKDYLGFPLSEFIYNFYRQANGLRLRWTIKPGITDDEFEKLSEISDDYEIIDADLESDEYPFANINILPIEESLIERNWQGIIYFEEDIDLAHMEFEFAQKTYNRIDFGKKLKPFDVYSNESCMAFLIEDNVQTPKVLCLGDHYIEWDSTRITDFNSYLEMLLATKGITSARDRIYSKYRGDRQPILLTPHDYWQGKRIPKLFSAIATSDKCDR